MIMGSALERWARLWAILYATFAGGYRREAFEDGAQEGGANSARGREGIGVCAAWPLCKRAANQ